MTNRRVAELVEINDISCELRRKRWNWLDHILKREGENDCFTAVGWTPEGRRARGRPKTTWRRTVEKERTKAQWVEELGSIQSGTSHAGVLGMIEMSSTKNACVGGYQSGCTRQKVLVTQRGGLMCLLAR